MHQEGQSTRSAASLIEPLSETIQRLNPPKNPILTHRKQYIFAKHRAWIHSIVADQIRREIFYRKRSHRRMRHYAKLINQNQLWDFRKSAVRKFPHIY